MCVCVCVKDGWTALMFASQDGHTETATLLLDRGATVNDTNQVGL